MSMAREITVRTQFIRRRRSRKWCDAQQDLLVRLSYLTTIANVEIFTPFDCAFRYSYVENVFK